MKNSKTPKENEEPESPDKAAKKIWFGETLSVP